MRTVTIGLAVFVGALLVLAPHCCHYMPFLADDALISLRYAQRLLQGHGLSWTDGRPVEGYSNLLWVLLAALTGRMGLDLVVGLRVLGFASASLLVGAIVYGHRAATLRQAMPMVFATAAVVLAGPTAVWVVGGLESVLVAGLLAWAVVLCYPIFQQENAEARHAVRASVFLALLCITRPDGALFAAAVVVALLLARGIRRATFRLGLWLVLLPTVFYLGQLAFRLAYYGQWIPNTALVKFAPSSTHLARGVVYVAGGLLSLSPLSLVTGLFGGCLLWQRSDGASRAKALLLIVPATAWSLYIASVGGDTFPGWRHIVPLIPLMALLLAQGTEQLLQQRGRSVVLVSAVLAVALTLYAYRQFHDGRNRLALSERWEWDGQVVGQMLRRGFGSARPLVAATACGCLPYWSELPALDMLGLNDYYLPRHSPEGFGHGTLSHELGDGQYVWDRQPDLLIFGGPRGLEKAHFLSGRQMQQKPEFYDRYTLVRFEGREPHTVQSQIWVRRHGGKTGIRAEGDRIAVPGYLLNGNPATVVHLDGAGQFVVSPSPGQPAAIEDLALPPGTWRVGVGSLGKVNVTIRPAGQNKVLVDAPAPVTFDWAGREGAGVDVTLSPVSQKAVEIRAVVFVRVRR
ncbi:MAG: hypothetical protein JXB62_12160 [Pirellulales bacterium]|nr:hypothetical protein [Pirellulales bacterium]